MTARTIHTSSIIVKHKNGSMWEKAIEHLQRELKRTTRSERVQQIQAAIATFRANSKRRVPWPRSQAKGHKLAQQHNA